MIIFNYTYFRICVFGRHFMERKIDKYLEQWKNDENKKWNLLAGEKYFVTSPANVATRIAIGFLMNLIKFFIWLQYLTIILSHARTRDK